MTDFDKKLIEKAKKISRFRYKDIDVLIDIADTEEARNELSNWQDMLYDLAYETL